MRRETLSDEGHSSMNATTVVAATGTEATTGKLMSAMMMVLTGGWRSGITLSGEANCEALADTFSDQAEE